MKKLGTFFLLLVLAAAVQAQEKKSLGSLMASNNILNHVDVGVGVGTTGISIDVAVPVTDYVRIRTGYNIMPRFNIHTDFPIETRGGSVSKLISRVGDLPKEMENRFGIDINSEGFEEYKNLYDKFSNIEAKDYATMGLKPNLNQFKFLVDVMPFKRNRHWSLTAGFFIGSSTVGEAWNLEEEQPLLEAVNTYNRIYPDYANNGIKGNFLRDFGDVTTDQFFKYGLAGFPLGKFSDGEVAMMIPNDDATVHAEMEMSSFRPYVGLGYNTHLSRNKRWKLNVDAGVLFICNKPKVYVDNVYKFDASPLKGHLDEDGYFVYESGIGTYVYEEDYSKPEYYGDIVRYHWNEETDSEEYIYCGKLQHHVDLMNDLHDIPGKVGDMVDFFSKLKVYPNISVSVSYRIF